jgi:hypothetical protein
VQRHVGNAFAPEADVDSSRFQQAGGELGVELSTREAELEQGVAFASFDLGCQHPGCRLPGLTPARIRVQKSDTPAGTGELAGAGGSHDAATNDDNVFGFRHLVGR